jgi:hypothetical protein
VAELARRMQQYWISTIGCRIFPPPRLLQFVVCDDVRYFRITVQGVFEALHA